MFYYPKTEQPTPYCIFFTHLFQTATFFKKHCDVLAAKRPFFTKNTTMLFPKHKQHDNHLYIRDIQTVLILTTSCTNCKIRPHKTILQEVFNLSSIRIQPLSNLQCYI